MNRPGAWGRVLTNIGKILRKDWSKKTFVGEDASGNKFYEISNSRENVSRGFDPPSKSDVSQPGIEWQAWMRGTRRFPPIENELISPSEVFSEYLALPFQEFDVKLPDINEHELVKIGTTNEVEHLSSGQFTDDPFPASGHVHGRNVRFMIPLACRVAARPRSPTVYVWFLLDTGAPYTCVTQRTMERFLGPGNVSRQIYHMNIQAARIVTDCQISRGHFEEVNILGNDYLEQMQLSILVQWQSKTFQLTK